MLSLSERIKTSAAEARADDPKTRRRGIGALVLGGAGVAVASWFLGYATHEQVAIRQTGWAVEDLARQDGFSVQGADVTSSSAPRALIHFALNDQTEETCLTATAQIDRDATGRVIGVSDYNIVADLKKRNEITDEELKELTTPGNLVDVNKRQFQVESFEQFVTDVVLLSCDQQ